MADDASARRLLESHPRRTNGSRDDDSSES
jgi:hypothetical protein